MPFPVILLSTDSKRRFPMNVEEAIFDMFEDKRFGLICKRYFRNVGLSKDWTACSRNFWTGFAAAMNSYFMVRCSDAIVQDFLQSQLLRRYEKRVEYFCFSVLTIAI